MHGIGVSALIGLGWLGLAGLAVGAPAPAASPAAARSLPNSPVAAATRPLSSTPVTSATQAREPGFYLQVEPKEVHIGDEVTVRLKIQDHDFQPDRIDDVTFNPDEKQWQVESQWRRDLQTPGDSRSEAWMAKLRPFVVGRLSIPATRVAYQVGDGKRIDAEATTTTLSVISIRPANAKQLMLFPLREPAPIARDLRWLWITIGALLACGLLGLLVFFWWRRRKNMPFNASPEPELPPGIWALRELDYRSRLPVCQTGPSKAIFSHVSEVVRIYLGRRYGIHAIDMTTLECLQTLHALHLSEEVLRWVREFLDECDMVKFTTIEPSRERWGTIWHDARLIVKMTTPDDELSPAGEPDQGVRREVAV